MMKLRAGAVILCVLLPFSMAAKCEKEGGPSSSHTPVKEHIVTIEGWGDPGAPVDIYWTRTISKFTGKTVSGEEHDVGDASARVSMLTSDQSLAVVIKTDPGKYIRCSIRTAAKGVLDDKSGHGSVMCGIAADQL